MASMKVRLGGKWVTVAGGGVSQEDLQQVVNEANNYANQLKEQIDDDIKAMEDSITGLENNIEGAFSDGIITKTEARRIQSYINTLETNKARFDKEYASLMSNEFMNENDKQGLITAKASHDEKFDLLIKAINDAIEDGKATVEEARHVNESFSNYNNAAAVLTSAIYEAIDDIATNKTGVALEEAKTFASQAAEGVKTILNAEVDGVKKSVTDLDTEIKGAFRDGIIQENELSTIKAYLNTLDTSKQGLDKRYESTYNNADLPADNKTNLNTVKIDYDRSYNALINTINDAIADQLGTPEEQELINTKFKDYNQKLALLTTQLELAIEAISKAKSSRAEKNAKDYSDQIKSDMADEIKGVEDATTALKTEIHTTFKDGIIDASEAQKIKSYINLLDNNKKALLERYTELYNNGFISPIAKTNLATKKSLFDSKYNLLISEINNAIADGVTTVSESQAVDSAFSAYNDTVKDFTNAMEKAADSIAQGKANAAEFNAGEYADEASNRLDVIKVRYIKNTLTSNSVNAYKHWTEIKAISKGVNVATTGTVTGSTGVTNLGVVNNDKVDDQFAEDRTAGDSFVQIDLGTVREDIDYIQLWHYYQDARQYNGNKLEVSADGQKWYTMFSSTKSGTYKESADGFIVPINAGRIYNHTMQRITTTETEISNINGVLKSVVKNTDFQQGMKDSKDYADTVAQAVRTELSSFSNMITTRIDGIEDQVDGNITTWFLSGAPTLTNKPSVDWNTDELKDTHLGDLYYDSATGYCYRFLKTGLIYAWTKITDSDVTEAIQKAAKAQDTADGKRRVFVVQPKPPYDVGDLWAQGSGGDLLRCNVAKAEGALFNAGDWGKASKYVDQQAVNDTLNPFVTRLETAESEVKQSAKEILERVKIETYNQEIININTNIGNIDTAQKGTADKLNKLAIGGRNVLKNSGNFVTIENWTSSSTTTATVMLDKDDLKISKVSTTVGVHVVNPSLRRLEWDTAKDYVITVRAKGSAAFSLDVGVTGDNGANVVLPFATIGTTGTDYKEFTLVFKPKVNGAADFRISTTPIPNGGFLWIDWIKVEEGNKPTAWSPAPEDLTDYADVAVGKVLDSSFEKGLRFWSGYNATIDVGAPLQSSVVYGTSSDSVTGRTAMSISNAEGWIFSANAIPVDTSRVYRVRFRVKKTKDVTSGGSNVYAGVATYDKNGNLQTTSPGNHRYCAVAGKPLKVADGWQVFEGYITGEGNANHNQFRPGTAYVKPMFVVDYQAGVGGTNVIDLLDFEDVTSQIKAQDYSSTKIEEAKTAQEAYARAQAEAAKTVANAYADGIVDAEEQRAIDDANAKLAQAKAHAEQKAKEAQDAAQGYVDGIEIGGTNLLKNAGFKDSLNYWSNGVGVVLDPSREFEGYPTVISNQTGLLDDAWRGISNSSYMYPCKPGDKFVGSVYTYTDNKAGLDKGAFVLVDFYDINGGRITGWSFTSIVPSKDNEWQRFTVNGVAPAGAVKARIWAYVSRNGKLWFSKPQLEKGNKATAWGLAPEDLVEAIGKVKVGGKNLLVGSEALTILSNNVAMYPVSVTKMTEGAVTFNRVKNTKAGTDVNTISVYNAIPFNVISDNLAGKQVTFSHQVRASKAVEGTLMHELYGASTSRFATAKFPVTTDWQTVTSVVDMPSNLSGFTGVRFLLSSFTSMVDQYVDYRPIKIEFGNRATDWTPAPEDVSKLIADVDTKAQNVTGRVDDMSADNRLTSLEKQDAKKDWDIIAGEYNNFYTQADAFKITSEKATYKTRYDELNTYLTPLFVKMNETSDIVRTDYRLKFKNYFEAKSALAKAISDASKSQIDSISIGGRNLVLGTSTPKSIVGNNTANQTTNIYDFAGGNSQKIIGAEFSVSFDWVIEGTAGGTLYLQGSNPYPLLADKITFSSTNNKGRYTVTKSGVTGSPFTSINMRLDNVPVGAKVTISNLKIELGNRITDWTPAPEDIDKLITDLDTKATTLQTSVDAMSDDNLLTPSEKSLLKKDWDSIVGEYPTISAQADAFGAVAEKTNYTSAYNALKGLIETPLANVTTTSSVNGADMRNKFKDYADRKSKLLRAVSDLAKSQIDGISVGGRNIITNSAFSSMTGWRNWGTATGTRPLVTNLDVPGLPTGFTITTTTTGEFGYATDLVKVIRGETYTLSAWAKITSDKGTVKVQEGDTTVKWTSTNTSVIGKWIRLSHTFVAKGDTTSIYIGQESTSDPCSASFTGVKLELGNKATDWSPAFEDVFSSIKDADDKAQRVQNSVNDMSADNKITALEKHQASKDWETVKAEYPIVAAQADAYGKTAEKTAYTTAYNNLKNYIEPILVKLNETSDIDGSNYRGLWKNYSDAKSKLLRAVTDGSKDAIDNISIGGRNLVLNSGSIQMDVTSAAIGGAEQGRKNFDLSPAFIMCRNKEVALSVDVWANGLDYGTTNPWVGFEIRVNFADSTSQYLSIRNGVIPKGSYDWTRFTTVARIQDKQVSSMILYCLARDFKGTIKLRDIKVEQGNRSTDWTPSTEEVQGNIDNITVGSRNYIGNGDFSTPLADDPNKAFYVKGDIQDIVDISTETPPHKWAFHCKNTTAKNNGQFNFPIFVGNAAKDLLGKEITVSMWIKYTGVVKGVNTWNSLRAGVLVVDYKKADGITYNAQPSVVDMIVGTNMTWRKVFTTFKMDFAGATEITRIGFKSMLEGCIGEFWVTGQKVEIGNKVTDWTPMPEEVNNVISTITTRVGSVEATTKNLGDSIQNKVWLTDVYTKQEILSKLADGEIYVKGTGFNHGGNRVLKINGATKYDVAASRGLRLTTLNRASLAIVDDINYDTYNNPAQQTALNDKLNSLDNSVLVVLSSWDAVNILKGTLLDTIANFGGSGAEIVYRTPYVLIGLKGLGKGSGIEVMTGQDKALYPVAEIYTRVSSGIPQGFNTSAKVLNDAVTNITTRVDTAESAITQHAKDIELKVNVNGVIAAINLSPEAGKGVLIKGENIMLDGYVKARHLAVTDLANIVGNSDFRDGLTGYTANSGMTLVKKANANRANEVPTDFVIEHNGRDMYYGDMFPINKEEVFSCSVMAKQTVGNALFSIGLAWYAVNSAGTTTQTNWGKATTFPNDTDIPNTPWKTQQGLVTAPSWATHARVWIQVDQPAATPTTKWQFTLPTVRRTGLLTFDQAKGGTLELGEGGRGVLRVYATVNGNQDTVGQIDENGASFTRVRTNILDVSGTLNAPNMVVTNKGWMEVYVDPANNGNYTPDGTQAKPYKTMREALNSLPRYLEGDVEIKIQSDVYEQWVDIKGFVGGGGVGGSNGIFIRAGTNGRKTIWGGIRVWYCSCQVYMQGINVSNSRDQSNGVLEAYGCTRVSAWDCNFTGNNKAKACIYSESSDVIVNGCEMYDAWDMVRTYRGYVQVIDCRGGNCYCVLSSTAGTIQGGGTRPGFYSGGIERYTDQGGWVSGSWTENTGSWVKPTPPVTIQEATIDSIGSKSWRENYGGQWYRDEVLQGTWDGWGNYRGMWFFGNRLDFLKGKTILDMQINIGRTNGGGYSSAQQVSIRNHNEATQPAGMPYLGSPVTGNYFAWGERKWVNVKALAGNFSSGNARGFGIYADAASPYMIFDGWCQVWVKYQ